MWFMELDKKAQTTRSQYTFLVVIGYVICCGYDACFSLVLIKRKHTFITLCWIWGLEGGENSSDR